VHEKAYIVPSLDDLDWNQMWKQARKKKTWRSKKAADWDRKAASFARRTRDSVYVDLFLERLAPRPEWTVLDMGCGPGTLALPLADRVRKVVAVDFSPVMLDLLAKRARETGRDNIQVIRAAWEDDWDRAGIPEVDVALASRSLAVQDLAQALGKLCGRARGKVVITDRVGHGPLDPKAFAAVGRTLEVGPDFIYTFNLIHQMGYLPSVDYLHLESELRFASRGELLESYLWMFKELKTEERIRLEGYLDTVTSREEDGSLILHRDCPPIWAMISWRPEPRWRRDRSSQPPAMDTGDSQCGS